MLSLTLGHSLGHPRGAEGCRAWPGREGMWEHRNYPAEGIAQQAETEIGEREGMDQISSDTRCALACDSS